MDLASPHERMFWTCRSKVDFRRLSSGGRASVVFTLQSQKGQKHDTFLRIVGPLFLQAMLFVLVSLCDCNDAMLCWLPLHVKKSVPGQRLLA